MKLCFVAPGRWSVDILHGDNAIYGGSESQLALLAAAMAQQGHQIDLIFGDGVSSAPTFSAGVRCIDAYPSWTHPRSLLHFWSLLKELTPDLIYTRLPSDFLWIIGLFTKLHPGSRFMYALGSDKLCNPWQFNRPKKWFHNPLYALGLRLADIVVVQHHGQHQLVKRYVNGRIVEIPNIVRLGSPMARNPDKMDIDIIWISQIRPMKQLSILLDVARELPNLQFTVVGGFSDTINSHDFVEQMGDLRNLRYLGPQDHESVMRLLARSRVLVNTSAWEGFPNTMLEAWSLGVPVVSLQIDPGNVISREGMGFVSGGPGQMVLDIKRLVEDPQLNCILGEKGFEYVQRIHSIEAVCQAFNQAISEFQVEKSAE